MGPVGSLTWLTGGDRRKSPMALEAEDTSMRVSRSSHAPLDCSLCARASMKYRMARSGRTRSMSRPGRAMATERAPIPRRACRLQSMVERNASSSKAELVPTPTASTRRQGIRLVTRRSFSRGVPVTWPSRIIRDSRPHSRQSSRPAAPRRGRTSLHTCTTRVSPPGPRSQRDKSMGRKSMGGV